MLADFDAQILSTADLDDAMLEFGMPMGPMRLLDEIGLDVAIHVAKTLAEALAAPLPTSLPPEIEGLEILVGQIIA